MIYCDTSVLVAAFAREARSAATQRWLSEHERDLVISWWVETEFASAIAIKRRMGALDDVATGDVLASWRRFVAAVAIEAVERRHYEAASAVVLASKTNLRGGDALHLVIARDAGHDFATFDRELAASCPMHGVTIAFGP